MDIIYVNEADIFIQIIIFFYRIEFVVVSPALIISSASRVGLALFINSASRPSTIYKQC